MSASHRPLSKPETLSVLFTFALLASPPCWLKMPPSQIPCPFRDQNSSLRWLRLSHKCDRMQCKKGIKRGGSHHHRSRRQRLGPAKRYRKT